MSDPVISRVSRLTAHLIALAIPCGANGQGGAPMITDDPGTPGDGNWEFNIAWTTEHAESTTAHEAPLLDINYGLGDRVQLTFEVPWIVVHESGAGSRDGLGNSMVGVKWRFFDAGDDGWKISTYPQVEFRNPGSSSVERELVEDGATVILPIEFERAFPLFGVNFEVGHTRHSEGDNGWFGGVVIGRELSGRLELMAELAAETTTRLERSAVTMNFGARWAVAGNGTLLVSVGRNLHNHLGEHKATVGYVGWQLMY